VARQVLPIVGAVAGFAVGGPTGAQIGFALGSMIGNAVDPIEMQGRKLGDAPTQVAAEGGARAIVYGKGCIRATVVLERGGRRVIRQRDRSGGKGGGPTTINERALWTFAIGLGEPVAAILRIWENEKLVYDVTPESQIPDDTAAFAEKFRFYDGSEDQLPDPALEALHGDDTPYYRGTAYLVFPQYDLTDFGETVPTYRVGVATNADVFYSTTVAVGDVVPSGLDRFFPSDNGTAFTDVQTASSYYARMQNGNSGRVINYQDGVSQYSEGIGEPWISGVGGGWPGGGGCSFADTVLLPSGNSGIACYRSTDNGETFTSIAGNRCSWLAYSDGIVIGLHAVNSYRSNNDGLSFDSAITVPGMASGNGICIAGLQNGFMVGAREPSGPPAIFRSPDGIVWTIHSFGTHPNSIYINNICPGVIGGVEIIVATGSATNPSNPGVNGDVWWSDDNGVTWTLVTTPTTPSFRRMIFNGERFIGVPYRAENPAQFWTSEDGKIWTVRTTSVVQAFFDIASSYGTNEAQGLPIPLDSVIAAMHERCGHTPADYDVSELSEMISGVVIESTVTGAEAINSVIGSHFADPSDYDGQIHYIKRGKAVQLTLTEDELIDEPEVAQRNNTIEYPKKVHFLGQRSDLAYASSKATSSRYSSDAQVVGEVTVGSPETFDDGTAPAEIAVKLHKVLWEEAIGEQEVVIPDNFLGLVPTDCVGFAYRDQLNRYRILNIEDTPGQRKLRMIKDRQSAYTASLTEIPNPPPVTPPQSSVVAPTVMAFIDSSALTDNADTLHYLVALSGANDNWAGAVLQQQISGAFTSIDSTTLNSIMGTLQNTVSDASPYYTDTTNTVVVRLFTEDELESRTDAEFLSNGGALFLSWEYSGQTQWEIMQFRDAVQDSNGDWVLSHLMRGRKNTETAEHPPGATFVWIDPAILREPAQTSWINTTLTHRAVSNGQSPELAAPQDNEYVGNSQREWPVADLLLSRPTADSVLAEAIPRYRFGTSMNPVRSQNMEQFTWSATDGVNATTVQTPFTTPSYTFDTTGWGSPVTVTVAQWNRLTGDGPTVSEEIV